jgi:hypothetical protein
MPGFQVTSPNGAFGGQAGIGGPSSNRTEYFYTYTWEIFNLFGNNVEVNSALIHLRDLTLPTFTANTDSYTASSLEYKWAKSVVWEDIKVSWYDTKGLLAIVKNWRQTVWTPTEGLKVGGDYKRMSELDVHLPTWNDLDRIRWRLYNSWPKVIKHGELTYTNSDVKLVEVTIAYDWAEEDPLLA